MQRSIAKENGTLIEIAKGAEHKKGKFHVLRELPPPAMPSCLCDPGKGYRAIAHGMKILLGLLFSFLVSLASAGQYILTDVSGGTSTSTSEGEDDYFDLSPIDPNDYDYGGYAVSDGGGTSNSGTVTYTFQWQPAYTGDTAPTAVSVLRKTRCYGHTEDFTYGTTRINTGFGQPDVTNTNGIYVYGQSTKIEPGGNTVLVTLSPSASSTSTWPEGLPPAYNYSGVATFARIKPIYIKFEGIKSPSDKRILIGQKLKATVMVGDDPAEGTFTWTVKPGAPFVYYDPATPASSYIKYIPPTESIASSTSMYFAKPANVTFTCTAVILSQEVALRGKVTTVSPTYDAWAIQGSAEVTDEPINPDTGMHEHGLYLWGAEYPNPASPGTNLIRGMWFVGWVTTPADFVEGSNRGKWGWIQLVTQTQNRVQAVDGSYATGSADFLPTYNAQGKQTNKALDYTAPYRGFWVDADGVQKATGDTPKVPVADQDGYDYVSSKSYFELYQMYQPPKNDSMMVPLAFIRWNWYGKAYRDNDLHLWNQPSAGNSSKEWFYVGDYPSHPDWLRVIVTNNLVPHP